MHGTDHPYAAVQTRDGPECNYRRYPAFVSPQSQSPSPCDSRTHTPACRETQTAHYIHTGRRGCMLTHADRHLPFIQRPHTRCHSPNTWSLSLTLCLTHTHHTNYTRGGTHPRCLFHTGGFAHTCRLPRARGFFPLRCPFHTRRAGKHALRHARNHTTRTRGLIRVRGFFHTRGRTCTRGLCRTRGLTRGLYCTRGRTHTRGFTHTRGRFCTHPYPPGMRASQHAF